MCRARNVGPERCRWMSPLPAPQAGFFVHTRGMALYLQLAVDIQHRPPHEWAPLLDMLPEDARGPVTAWLRANPSCDASVRRAWGGTAVDFNV